MIMKIKCPNCGKQADYTASNIDRPFCSEKCRLLDFGDWIEEKNGIPDEPITLVDTDTEIIEFKH